MLHIKCHSAADTWCMEIHYLVYKENISAYLDGEINGINRITDTNISKYIKPAMELHIKLVISAQENINSGHNMGTKKKYYRARNYNGKQQTS